MCSAEGEGQGQTAGLKPCLPGKQPDLRASASPPVLWGVMTHGCCGSPTAYLLSGLLSILLLRLLTWQGPQEIEE